MDARTPRDHRVRQDKAGSTLCFETNASNSPASWPGKVKKPSSCTSSTARLVFISYCLPAAAVIIVSVNGGGGGVPYQHVLPVPARLCNSGTAGAAGQAVRCSRDALVKRSVAHVGSRRKEC
jgi:hypothetical protein